MVKRISIVGSDFWENVFTEYRGSHPSRTWPDATIIAHLAEIGYKAWKAAPSVSPVVLANNPISQVTIGTPPRQTVAPVIQSSIPSVSKTSVPFDWDAFSTDPSSFDDGFDVALGGVIDTGVRR